MGGGWRYLKGSFGLCVLKGFKIECSLKINKWLGVVASSLRDIITIKTGNYFEKKNPFCSDLGVCFLIYNLEWKIYETTVF